MFTRIKKTAILNILIAGAFLIGVAHISNRTAKEENLFIQSMPEIDSEPSTQHSQSLEKAEKRIKVFESEKGKVTIGFSQNSHCAYPNVIERSLNEEERITLILHISYDRLNPSIVRQIDNWDGPISLAVVFPDRYSSNSPEVKCITNFLNVLQNNHTGAAEKLSAHIMIQNKNGNCGKINIAATDDSDLEKATCKDTNVYTERELVKKMGQYAVNDARNLARKLSSTKYILVADMDHFFSKDFESKMLGLAGTVLDADPKTVLVYRIFEVSSDAEKMPETKAELQKLLRENKAQEFHKFYGAHSIPKLQAWFKKTDHGPDNTSIQFYRKYNSYHWEPQFVSLTNIPFHDTSFFYSLRDNTVLRWEMCRAGYKFAIVDDVFMYHPGIKTREESTKIDKVRNYVRRWSYRALRRFNRRMDETYPDSKNACPKMSQF